MLAQLSVRGAGIFVNIYAQIPERTLDVILGDVVGHWLSRPSGAAFDGRAAPPPKARSILLQSKVSRLT
jgi:hypothetical protein